VVSDAPLPLTMSSLPPSATFGDALAWATGVFGRAGISSPRTEAEWLLSGLFGTHRAGLYLSLKQRLISEQQQRLLEAVRRRCLRMPLQQILGETEFFSLSFEVTPSVLIPRPETEILVETLIERLKDRPAPHILDLGTGSGAIAVALAHTLPKSRVVATDLSKEALRVARTNAGIHRTETRIAFVQGNLFRPFPRRPIFHAIASNPPYIPSEELPYLQPEVANFEPRIALDGGADGLRFYRPIIAQADARLFPGGWLILEVGQGQAGRVASLLLKSPGFGEPEIVRDLVGRDRVLLAQKSGRIRGLSLGKNSHDASIETVDKDGPFCYFLTI